MDVKADQRARGRYLGGKVPFGYRVEGGVLVPVPEQQAAVRTILRLGRGTRNRKPLSLRHVDHHDHEHQDAVHLGSLLVSSSQEHRKQVRFVSHLVPEYRH